MSGNEERELTVQVSHKLIQVLAKYDGFLKVFSVHASLRVQCYFYVLQSIFCSCSCSTPSCSQTSGIMLSELEFALQSCLQVVPIFIMGVVLYDSYDAKI